MLEVVVSGLVTGWAIAVPVGAIGAFLVTLTARTSLRVGAAGALGIATVDGVYAAVAVLAGATLSSLLAPVATPLRLVSGVVLLGVAAVVGWQAVRSSGTAAEATSMTPGRAYVVLLGLTAVNPATVVYFTAVVLGNRELTSGAGEAVVFVVAAFAASASWQLVLAGGGAALGQVATGHATRVATGLVAALVIAVLAVHTMLG